MATKNTNERWWGSLWKLIKRKNVLKFSQNFFDWKHTEKLETSNVHAEWFGFNL